MAINICITPWGYTRIFSVHFSDYFSAFCTNDRRPIFLKATGLESFGDGNVPEGMVIEEIAETDCLRACEIDEVSIWNCEDWKIWKVLELRAAKHCRKQSKFSKSVEFTNLFWEQIEQKYCELKKCQFSDQKESFINTGTKTNLAYVL